MVSVLYPAWCFYLYPWRRNDNLRTAGLSHIGFASGKRIWPEQTGTRGRLVEKYYGLMGTFGAGALTALPTRCRPGRLPLTETATVHPPVSEARQCRHRGRDPTGLTALLPALLALAAGSNNVPAVGLHYLTCSWFNIQDLLYGGIIKPKSCV